VEITVVTIADVVRRRPDMYFGSVPGDPLLAGAVLRTVASHVAPAVVDITDDLAFSVTDGQAQGPGYNGTLLPPGRWSTAAAASVSLRTTVAVWHDGHGLRQTLAGVEPVESPTEFRPPPGAGTRVAFLLDPAFFGSSVLNAPDLAGVTVRDHRATGT
jgi:DNA gyrase/topoisomerase IV subunit B